MKSRFPGYYRPSPEAFRDLWASGIVAVDANVLLDVYRYSEGTANDLLEIFSRLEHRLWIPYQAAQEYHQNLEATIASQISPYDTARQQAQDLLSLLSKPSRHPFVPNVLLKDLEALIQRLETALQEGKGRLEELLTQNPLKERLAQIFDGKIGEPLPEDLCSQIIASASRRFDQNIPPGYMDREKPEPKRYGDLLIWHQLMAEARARKKPLLFVSADVKEDWFLRVGGKTLGPRPELCEEFGGDTDQLFYAYPTESFLAQANKYLKAQVKQATIEEVQLREDDYLLQRLRGGDPRALETLYDTYSDHILDVIRQLGATEEDTPLIFNEVVRAASRALRNEAESVSDLRDWLTQQTIRRTTSHLWRKRRLEGSQLERRGTWPRRPHSSSMLRRLPGDVRETYRLRQQGLSIEQIAELTGKTIDNVQQELDLARDLLPRV
jgi:DNA-directed RNA polymerase specialized sigma24 family protein